MSIPNWLYGYARTPEGSGVLAAVRAGDTPDVEALGPGAEMYRRRWEQLQEDIAAGVPLDVDALSTVTRELVDNAQADTVATGRVDLHDSLAALTGLPGGAGDFFHEFLSPEPDRYLLRLLSAPFHGNVKFEDSSRQATATLYFEDGHDWPAVLGGSWTSELLRSITVSSRYAKWRDRRVRRLCRVQVEARDVVPA